MLFIQNFLDGQQSNHSLGSLEARVAFHSGSLSFMLQTSRSRLAITRQAEGEMSMPIH
jgi:hypothetical protein